MYATFQYKELESRDTVKDNLLTSRLSPEKYHKVTLLRKNNYYLNFDRILISFYILDFQHSTRMYSSYMLRTLNLTLEILHVIWCAILWQNFCIWWAERLFWQLTIEIRWKCSIYMLKMLQGIEFDFLKFSFEKNSMDKEFSISQKIKIRRSSMERESAPIMKSGPYWIELKIHNGYWIQCRPLFFLQKEC